TELRRAAGRGSGRIAMPQLPLRSRQLYPERPFPRRQPGGRLVTLSREEKLALPRIGVAQLLEAAVVVPILLRAPEPFPVRSRRIAGLHVLDAPEIMPCAGAGLLPPEPEEIAETDRSEQNSDAGRHAPEGAWGQAGSPSGSRRAGSEVRDRSQGLRGANSAS